VIGPGQRACRGEKSLSLSSSYEISASSYNFQFPFSILHSPFSIGGRWQVAGGRCKYHLSISPVHPLKKVNLIRSHLISSGSRCENTRREEILRLNCRSRSRVTLSCFLLPISLDPSSLSSFSSAPLRFQAFAAMSANSQGNLDEQIEQLMQCKPLSEQEVTVTHTSPPPISPLLLFPFSSLFLLFKFIYVTLVLSCNSLI
jgi:hypothetical protein